MPPLLELRHVAKRMRVGAGGCTASVAVLRDVNLELREGETLAIVGGAGVGKTILLLCAAGLSTPDSGEVRWYGSTDRGAAHGRVHYRFRAVEPARRRERHPELHIVDGVENDGGAAAAARLWWLERQRAEGSAVLIATRDGDLARALAGRVLLLRSGRVSPDERPAPARVAEVRRASQRVTASPDAPV